MTNLLRLSLFLILTLSVAAPAAAAKPPQAAEDILTEFTELGLTKLPEALTDAIGKFEKISSTHYVIKNLSVNKVKTRLVLYKPSGAGKYLMAAIFDKVTLDKLGISANLLSQVSLKSVVVVYAGEKLTNKSVANWKKKIGEKLKDLSPSTNKLTFVKGLNVFARLDDGASGETADLLKAVGLKLKDITVHASKSVEKKKSKNKSEKKDSKKKSTKNVTLTARIHRWGDWSKPFGFSNTTLKNLTLQVKQDEKKNKNVQAWGDFKLKGKTYFLWAGQSKGPTKVGRAFGLGAKEMSLKTVMDFVDAMPAMSSYKLGKAVADNLPVADVKITNDKFKAYEQGKYPDPKTFTVFYADPFEEVATTGTKAGKSPIFSANGKAKILKWEAASLNAFIDPARGLFQASGKMKTPKLDPLPLSKAKFNVAVDKARKRYAMKVSGDFEFEGITIAGAALSMSKTKFKMSVNLGCLPPMLKGTLATKYSATSIPKIKDFSIKGSGCGKKIADAIAAAAKKVGHTLKKAINKVGDAIADLARSIGKKEKKLTNKDVPLFRTAARHMMLQEILDDWRKGVDKVNMTAIVLDDVDIPFDMGSTLPKIYATKSDIEKQQKKIECQAKGRMSALLKLKKGVAGAVEVTSEAIDAEIKFYEPFQDMKKEVNKILKNKTVLDPEWIELSVCENG